MKDDGTNETDPALEQRLTRLLGTRHIIPAAHADRLDRTVLSIASARADLIRKARRQTGMRRFAAYAAAAAASVAILVFGAMSLVVTRQAQESQQAATDHQTDIVDVYRMARSIQSGETLPSAYDFNKDGSVNDRDVEELARRVVSVSGQEGNPGA